MLRWVLVLCTWTLVLHTSHATTSTTFRHAWQQYCSGRETKCSGAHIPQKAYVISLPDDVEKRDYLLPQLKTLGLEVEVVDGIHADQLGEGFTKCEAAMSSTNCQAGLTRAHMDAWRRIVNSGEPAGWVFEDDAVFHDRAVQLFPKYWAAVRKDFQFVSVGQVYPDNMDVKKTAVVAAPERLPWGTHAYIIRAETAERMANLGEWMISRARKNTKDKTPWALDGDDIKIDHFIGNFYKKLVNEVERERWAVFQSPAHMPWSYGHVLGSVPSDCRCWCDLDDCLSHGTAPVYVSEGLASQHTCGNNIAALVRWHQEMDTRSKTGQPALCAAPGSRSLRGHPPRIKG